MRLSTLERKFLSCATLDASRSIPILARQLHTSGPRLRYAIQALIDKKIVRNVPLINRSRLGMTDYHIYFSIAARSQSARLRFSELLSRSPNVVFLAEVGGDFQYEVIVSCSTALAASLLLDDAGSAAQVQIRAKSIASNVAMRLFCKRYLAPAPPANRTEMSLDFVRAESAQSQPFVPDDIDTRLLRRLSDDGGISLRQTAAELGISHTGVQYRIDKLRKLGVFGGTYYDVEPARYGYQDFIWQLGVSHNRRALERRILQVAAADKSVSYVASYFGDWDFELGVEVPEARLINAAVQELSEQLGPEFSTRRLLMRFDEKKLRPFPL